VPALCHLPRAPTLLIGDNFLVSKPACGQSHFSLPLSPCSLRGAIGQPAKPTVGLPGDRIEMKDGLINDRKSHWPRRNHPLLAGAGQSLGNSVGADRPDGDAARLASFVRSCRPDRNPYLDLWMISLTEQIWQRFLV
jgi:signal peptidase I